MMGWLLINNCTFGKVLEGDEAIWTLLTWRVETSQRTGKQNKEMQVIRELLGIVPLVARLSVRVPTTSFSCGRFWLGQAVKNISTTVTIVKDTINKLDLSQKNVLTLKNQNIHLSKILYRTKKRIRPFLICILTHTTKHILNWLCSHEEAIEWDF